MNRKPRADSMLKTLPEERQAAIAEHARGHTLAETVAWLKQDGLKTSSAALSQFLSWYLLQQKLQRNENTVETLLEEARKTNPRLSAAKIQEMGQAFFSALALSEQDPDAWVNVQHLSLSERSAQFKAEIEKAKLALRQQAEARAESRLKFEREKFEFDAAKAALKEASALKVISHNSKLSEPEKVNLARQKLFGFVPPAAK